MILKECIYIYVAGDMGMKISAFQLMRKTQESKRFQHVHDSGENELLN